MAQLSIMSAGRAIQVCNVTCQMNHTVKVNKRLHRFVLDSRLKKMFRILTYNAGEEVYRYENKILLMTFQFRAFNHKVSHRRRRGANENDSSPEEREKIV